jgi:predicted ATPase
MEIKIAVQNYRCFGDAPAEVSLKNGVSAFIGANNSGKSTILRFFFEFRPLFEQLRTDIGWIAAALNQGAQFAFPRTITDFRQVFHKRNDRDLSICVNVIDPSAESAWKEIKLTISRENGKATLDWEGVPRQQYAVMQGEGGPMIHDSSSGRTHSVGPMQNVFGHLTRTAYVGPYRSISELGPTGDYFDLQVGRAFVDRWNAMKVGADARNNDAAVAVERQIQRVFKFREFQINATEDKGSLQVIIDNSSYKIQEVGSGLAQFVISLAHVAMGRPRYVLIDEPESNLHASMQLSFLTSLAAYAPGGLLFASHNLGLARSAAERIYVVHRTEAGVSEIRNLEVTGTLSEVVGELNFSAYQELGFSALLLVEGPTELKAVQQFLRKLSIEQHVLMIPLGGSSMINGNREDELRELKRITANIFALIDSEKTANDDALGNGREGFRKACGSVGITCHVTERRALENYFSAVAIEQVHGKTYGALAPFESMRADSRWAKSENWRITQAMQLDDLNKTDLGSFFTRLKQAVQAKGGTNPSKK